MAGLLNLFISVVLKHILDRERKNPLDSESEDDGPDEDEEEEDEDELEDYTDRNGSLATSMADDSGKLRDRRHTGSSYTGGGGGRGLIKSGSQSSKSKKVKMSRQLQSKKRSAKSSANRINFLNNAELLDFDGPKLIIGIKNWLFFYQLLGQINFSGRPFYMSLLFKLFVFVVWCYAIFYRFILKFYNLRIINENYSNPIFVFISCLASITLTTQVLITLRVNLFDLCPMYKILTTPKLCFLKTEVQHVIGTRTLSAQLIFHLYQGLLLSMAVSKNLDEYINQFYLPTFLLDIYVNIVGTYYLIGIAQIDLYIRSAFGHWLLALKSHLEQRFTHLHRYQRKSLRLKGIAAAGGSGIGMNSIGAGSRRSNSSSEQNQLNLLPERLLVDNEANSPVPSPSPPLMDSSAAIVIATTNKSPQQQQQEPALPPLITFDEIQRNLNNMDDHLEVLRSVQISSLVLLTLNAFLSNGALFLLTYHLFADQSNFYHGFIFLLLSVNYIYIIFMCYSSDRWVFYALSSFVQTVEDEYFMQSDIKASSSVQANNNSNTNNLASSQIERETWTPDSMMDTNQAQQMLLIKKKDVLFCREFLHQFENHLATPWSKLTFKTHLHMLRTFVTLIAAQIIFDHEH